MKTIHYLLIFSEFRCFVCFHGMKLCFTARAVAYTRLKDIVGQAMAVNERTQSKQPAENAEYYVAPFGCKLGLVAYYFSGLNLNLNLSLNLSLNQNCGILRKTAEITASLFLHFC